MAKTSVNYVLAVTKSIRNTMKTSVKFTLHARKIQSTSIYANIHVQILIIFHLLAVYYTNNEIVNRHKYETTMSML